MFGLVMAVFFAWSREKLRDAGLGWLESARRSNFATLVARNGTPAPGPARQATARQASARAENVDDDEHLAAYNAYWPGSTGPRTAVPAPARHADSAF